MHQPQLQGCLEACISCSCRATLKLAPATAVGLPPSLYYPQLQGCLEVCTSLSCRAAAKLALASAVGLLPSLHYLQLLGCCQACTTPSCMAANKLAAFTSPCQVYSQQWQSTYGKIKPLKSACSCPNGEWHCMFMLSCIYIYMQEKCCTHSLTQFCS